LQACTGYVPGVAGNHSVQNPLSPRLPSKNVKIKAYNNIVLPVVLYGCKTWFPTLKKEYVLTVFGNRELGTFGLKTNEMKRRR
jgi:hypothetical protein